MEQRSGQETEGGEMREQIERLIADLESKMEATKKIYRREANEQDDFSKGYLTATNYENCLVADRLRAILSDYETVEPQPLVP